MFSQGFWRIPLLLLPHRSHRAITDNPDPILIRFWSNGRSENIPPKKYLAERWTVSMESGEQWLSPTSSLPFLGPNRTDEGLEPLEFSESAERKIREHGWQELWSVIVGRGIPIPNQECRNPGEGHTQV